MLGNFIFLHLDFFFFHFFFKKKNHKKFIGNTMCLSNILDPDQACHFVMPVLGSNCLQK